MVFGLAGLIRVLRRLPGRASWEVERLGEVPGAPNEEWALGGAAKLPNGDEIAGIHDELAIAEADQRAVLHFADHFYSQSEILSHFLLYVRVHSSPSLIEI